ncbi:hypothetical protein V8E53_002969 [Lactarius tabidus]
MLELDPRDPCHVGRAARHTRQTVISDREMAFNESVNKSLRILDGGKMSEIGSVQFESDEATDSASVARMLESWTGFPSCTELHNVPIDIIVGSVANKVANKVAKGRKSGTHWADCAGLIISHFIHFLRRRPILAVSASEGIKILRNTTFILITPQEKMWENPGRAGLRTTIPGLPCRLQSATPLSAVTCNPRTRSASPEAPSFDLEGEERMLQDIVDEALAQGVWITRARRLRGQELVDTLRRRSVQCRTQFQH